MTPRPIYSGRQRYKSTCRPIANTHTICGRTVHYLATARGRRLLGRPGHANVRRAGHAPPGPARAPTQGVHPAHDRLAPWPALRPQPTARPAQTDPSQPRLGLGHQLLTARHLLLCLSVRLPGRSHQARGRLARDRHDTRKTRHYGCAAGFFSSAAYPGTRDLLRPRRPVLQQCLPSLIAPAPVRSQNRRGDCYDNAQAESLWSRSKQRYSNCASGPLLPT